MRTAVLALAFEGLDALEALSGAFADNPQSSAVSRKLGYVRAGHNIRARREQRAVEHRYVIGRETWGTRARPAVDIGGLEPCLELFGAA